MSAAVLVGSQRLQLSVPTDVVGYVEVFNYISLVGVVEQLVFAVRVLDRRLHVLLELLERTDDLGLYLGYFYIVSELLDVLCLSLDAVALGPL